MGQAIRETSDDDILMEQEKETPENGGEMITFTLRMPPKLRNALGAVAKEYCVSKNAF